MLNLKKGGGARAPSLPLAPALRAYATPSAGLCPATPRRGALSPPDPPPHQGIGIYFFLSPEIPSKSQYFEENEPRSRIEPSVRSRKRKKKKGFDTKTYSTSSTLRLKILQTPVSLWYLKVNADTLPPHRLYL
jgi:hypothetical protein